MWRNLRMPAEWGAACVLLDGFPYTLTNWRLGAVPAQRAFVDVACAIAAFEPVRMCVPSQHLQVARSLLQSTACAGKGVSLVELDYDDAWMRDIGPTFVFAEGAQEGELGPGPGTATGGGTQRRRMLVGVDWIFNAWGHNVPRERDECMAANLLEVAGVPRIKADIVLEGGSIHTDGDGTLVTTEECLLNPNRNPHLSKQQIEERLMHFLGVEKVLWLPRGLAGDVDPGFHVDNMCCFVRPGVVLLAWTDNAEDEHYARCREALEVLKCMYDARQRRIQVVKLPIPPLMYRTLEDCEGITEPGASYRRPGDRLAASYVNSYIASGGIVCPSFGCDTDKHAQAILEEAFPQHSVMQVPSREVLLGGGNIHCITQQQPALR